MDEPYMNPEELADAHEKLKARVVQPQRAHGLQSP